MGRLIDADESINRIVKIRPTNPKQSDYSHGVDVGLAMAMVAIEEQPTIDPVRKGKWIPLQLSMANPPYQCSCCFRNAPMVETGCLVNRHLEALLTDWCPWCGAKMEEGEQDG